MKLKYFHHLQLICLIILCGGLSSWFGCNAKIQYILQTAPTPAPGVPVPFPQPSGLPVPVPVPVPQPIPSVSPQPTTDVPQPTNQPQPVPVPTPQPEPIPVPVPSGIPQPGIEPSPQPVPVPTPQPNIPSPQPVPSPQLVPVPVPVPVPSPQPVPTPTPSPTPPMEYSFNNSCGVANITESYIDGDIIDLIVVNGSIVIIQTTKHSLYRTTDGGVTWINQASALSNNPINNVIQSPADPFKIYFITNYYTYLYTLDGGQTYILSNYVNLYQIIPHPTLPNTFAGIFFGVDFFYCPSVLNYVCFELYFTNDTGVNWFDYNGNYNFNLFFGSTVYASWGPAGTNGQPDGLFYAIMYDPTTDLSAIYTTTDYYISSSRNVIPSSSNNILGFLDMEEVGGFLIFSRPTQPANADISVFLADINFINVSQATFPVSDATNTLDTLAVPDITPGSIFVAIHRDNEPDNSYELLVSDSLAGQFTISLNDIVADPSIVNFDFFKVPGLEGIFIANKWSYEGSNIQETYISFNKGGTWQLITPPAVDLISCDNCSLFFYGVDFLDGELYIDGDRESNGVLIANGITTNTNHSDPSQGNIYISRDAGESWNRLYPGTWKFDSSNTAGFIALAQWNKPSQNILFTRDQGLSWDNCLFQSPTDNRNQTVLHIFTDLTPQNRSLWLLNQWSDSTNTIKYSILHMDFNNNSIQFCQPSDYEYFSPNGNGDSCVLGKNITVKRRKQDAICYVDPNEEISIITPCPCSRSDYICSYCFTTNTSDPYSPCVLIPTSPCNSLVPSDCTQGGTYQLYPYKKIQGTSCIGDLIEFQRPELFDCILQPNPDNNNNSPPATKNLPYIIGFSILGGLILIAIIGVIIWVLAKRFQTEKFTTLSNEL